MQDFLSDFCINLDSKDSESDFNILNKATLNLYSLKDLTIKLFNIPLFKLIKCTFKEAPLPPFILVLRMWVEHINLLY